MQANKTMTMLATTAALTLGALALGLATSLPWIFALMFSIGALSLTIGAIVGASMVSGERAPLALHRTAARRRAII